MPFIVPLLGSPARITGIDAGNEAWSFSLYGVVLTVVNWAAEQALWATVITTAEALILGAVKSTEYGNKTDIVYAQPTNGAARELALILRCKDATTQERLSYRLPTVDPTIPVYIANVDARDAIDPTTPSAMVDFLTAFEAFAKNPRTGNALAVYGVRVGRGGK